MQDTFKFQGMRKKLIGELREKGIADEKILTAFDAVPRHFFLDNAFADQAYSDIPFQIGKGQTISQPFTVAFQTQLLEVKKGDKILEIGTGSGYQGCILAAMGAKVYSIERHKELHLKAKQMFRQFHFNAHLVFGDGFKGLPSYAPFDKIIITCGAPIIPPVLIEQLKIGGYMVVPLGEGEKQTMLRLTKISESEFQEENYGTFSFVPMLEDKAK